jgi:hypothetical protein
MAWESPTMMRCLEENEGEMTKSVDVVSWERRESWSLRKTLRRSTKEGKYRILLNGEIEDLKG